MHNGEVRIALVGCEVEGRQMLVDLDRIARAGARVVAACDRDDRLAAEAAARFGIPDTYDSVDALTAAGGCDAILNFDASAERDAATEAALAAGLHVYSDKPFAFGADDARRLAALSEEHDVALLSAPAISLWPAWRVVRSLVEAGDIGRPIGIRAQFDSDPWPWSGWDGDPSWYFDALMGPLRDMGPYAIHVAMDLFGPIAELSCAASQLIPERRIIDGPRAGEDLREDGDDAFALSLGFAGGEYAFIHATSCAHGSRVAKCEVFGEFGAIACDPFKRDADITVRRVADYDAEPVVERIGPDDIVARAGGGTLGLDLVAGLEEFVDVIRSPRESRLGPARNVHVIEVLERAHDMVRAGSEGPALGRRELDPTMQGGR